jgi:ATP-dependent exoDNAse (exonuclease V) alpha subunit
MAELTLRQARELLTGWKADQETVAGRRDEVVLAAVEAGLSKSEICRITGLARTTIDRILGSAPEGGEPS